MNNEEWSNKELKGFFLFFFGLTTALGAFANWQRTGTWYWPILAVITTLVTQTYADSFPMWGRGETEKKQKLWGKIRQAWKWAVWEDPRWTNVPRLKKLRDKLKYLVFVGILLVPGAVAQDTFPGDEDNGESHILRYNIDTFNSHVTSITGPQTLLVHEYNASKLHNQFVTNAAALITIHLETVVLETSDGSWVITLDHPSIPTHCTRHILTVDATGILSVPFPTKSAYYIACNIPLDTANNNVYNNQTLTINITVDDGSPSDIEHLDLTVQIERQDTALYPMNIEITNLWQFLPLIVAIVFMILGETKRDVIYKGAAGLLFFFTIIPAWNLFPIWTLGIFAAIGLYLLLAFMMDDTEVGKRIRKN